MRILHTSDWHLGHELHGYSRVVEHEQFMRWLLTVILEQSVDVLVITGDLYDAANPPVDAQQRFYRFLSDALAVSAHLHVVVVGGNHDSAARIELPKPLVDGTRVHFVGALPRTNGKIEPERAVFKLIDDKGKLGAVCAAVPYLRPADVAGFDTDENAVAELYQLLFQAARASAGENAVPILLTGHLHVAGAFASEDSERRIFIGGQEALPSSVFPADAAYVALGHLHRPQAVPGPPLIRYAGAPFPMALDERTYEHSIVLVDVGSGNVHTTLVKTPRSVQFIRVPADGALPIDEVEDLLRDLDVGSVEPDHEPYLEVCVRVDTAEPDLRRRVEHALEGKPVKLARIHKQASGLGGTLADDVDPGAELFDLQPDEVFRRLHQREYQADPPDDLQAAFRELVSTCAGPQAQKAGAE